MDAASFHITYQLKILTTAIFAVILLNKQLSFIKWISLFLLATGVAFVQLSKLENIQTKGSMPFVGFIFVLLASLLSGFAGIW
jgi:UDP-sugar transporter A1/2/3